MNAASRSAARGPCWPTRRGFAMDARTCPQCGSHQRFISGSLAQRSHNDLAIRHRAANQDLPQRRSRREKVLTTTHHAPGRRGRRGFAHADNSISSGPRLLTAPKTLLARNAPLSSSVRARQRTLVPKATHFGPSESARAAAWSLLVRRESPPNRAAGPARPSSSDWPSFAQPHNVDSDSGRHP